MLREYPVTWLMLFGCPLIWMLDLSLSLALNISYVSASQMLGAADEVSLWGGAWWRVLTTAFHHGGFIHLLCNMLTLGLFGRLLEFRLGSFHYLLFCIAGLAVSSLAQSFWSDGVGLSGLLYAQFGLIWIWRKSDEWWRDQVHDQIIQGGFIWFFACFVLDAMKILPIGNIAHAAGLAYGYCVGTFRFGSPKVKLWWPAFLSAHIFLVPGFYFLMHPEWNGRYHWWQGDQATSPADRIRHYGKALQCDPDLEGPWINLALAYMQERDVFEAWRCILKGLYRHPSSQKAIDEAREISRYLAGPHLRGRARQMLAETFGEQAGAWEAKLFTDVQLEQLRPLTLPPGEHPDRLAIAPDARIEEPDLPELPTTLPDRALDEIVRPPRKLPAPNPDDPGSAEEGKAA